MSREDKARVGDILFDLQLPAGALRRHLRQFSDQAGRRGNPPRTAADRDLRHAIAGPGLSRLGRGQRRPGRREAGQAVREAAQDERWQSRSRDVAARMRTALEPLAAYYFLKARARTTAGSSIPSPAFISATARGSSGSTGWPTFRHKGLIADPTASWSTIFMISPRSSAITRSMLISGVGRRLERGEANGADRMALGAPRALPAPESREAQERRRLAHGAARET